MTIRTRFHLIFAIIAVLILTLALGTMSVSGLSREQVERIHHGALIPSLDLKTVSDAYTTAAIVSAVRVRVGDMPWDQGEAAVRRAKDAAGPAWERYIAHVKTQTEREIVRTAQDHMDEANTALDELIDILGAQDIAGLTAFIARDMYPSVNPLLVAIQELTALQDRYGESIYADALEQVEGQRMRLAILMAAALVVFLLAYYTLRNRVVGPLVTMTDAMAAVAGGRLDRDIPSLGKRDEIGALAAALARFRDNARQLRDDQQRLHDLAEELRDARDRAEEATRAKSSFLAMMSHEIRTPMNGVVAMAEMMDQTELTGDQRGMLDIVRASSASLLTIINDILDFSKIEAGRLELEAIELSLVDVVEGTAEILAGRAEEKGLGLVVDIDPAVPSLLVGDPVRLRQVLLNLIGNAIKFTEHGGIVVTVAAAPGPGPDVSLLRFAVRDDGIGLTPAQCDTLFRPFQQADSSTSRQYGGTGLGLAICRHLCTLMGGRIGVESVHGEGSTFWFEVPLTVVDWTAPAPSIAIGDARLVAVGFGDGPERHALAAMLAAAGVEDVRWLDRDGLADTPGASGADAEDGRRVVILWRAAAEDDALDTGGRDPAVVLVASRKLASRLAEAHRAGVFCTLTLPLRRDRLWHVIAAALGRASLERRDRAADGATSGWQPPTLEEARAAGALVLVAEDNATNQAVIRRMLSQGGYAFEIASNGVEALKLHAAGRYGLLLTDFHMPEMDGFALTSAIRSGEAEGVRLPIVALTADALPGTEQRCLDAGMDAYLTKPVDSRRLFDLLERFLPQARDLRRRAPPAETATPKAAAPPADPLANPLVDPQVLNLAYLGDIFAGAAEQAEALVRGFIGGARGMIDESGAALAAGDLSGARETVHALKGGAHSVGATRLGQLAGDLQDALDAGDGDTAALLHSLLAMTLDELADAADTAFAVPAHGVDR
ncbi:response regulator [Azospirillum sp. YIM B02556]|uniref:histidine kinase n=1 Tax=Azospirillum endophyticum TaxID=2800326 RepID=A0ABS1F654_9PROT|nr:ATP-binding protein [Azospirillum endophyticum]MBK1838911.1 response regulator [Azospirillum endophyticum]